MSAATTRSGGSFIFFHILFCVFFYSFFLAVSKCIIIRLSCVFWMSVGVPLLVTPLQATN
jgi:hypothetical protein